MYKYTGNDKISAFNVQLKGSTSTRAHYELSFPSPLPGSYEEGRTAFGEYFLPLKAGKVPLLILAHGYGDTSLAPWLDTGKAPGQTPDRYAGPVFAHPFPPFTR